MLFVVFIVRLSTRMLEKIRSMTERLLWCGVTRLFVKEAKVCLEPVLVLFMCYSLCFVVGGGGLWLQCKCLVFVDDTIVFLLQWQADL